MLIPTLLLLFASLATPQPQALNIPDTPAGHTLKAWLDAFNSGDRATEEKYLKTYDPERSLDDEMRFRGMTGGFILTQILKSDPERIEFMVKERNSDTIAIGKMEVKPGEPAKVASFGLRAVPSGTKDADLSFKIDAATRAKVIDGAVAALNDIYVFPETAKKMEEAVRAHQRKGDYDAISDGDDFAKRLTDDFQAISHDKHLRVMFSPAALPDFDNQKPDPKRDAEERKEMERVNCGFKKAEILEGNIGYLKFDFRARPTRPQRRTESILHSFFVGLCSHLVAESASAFRDLFFGATLEQAKDGPELVSATGATTWIEFAAGS